MSFVVHSNYPYVLSRRRLCSILIATFLLTNEMIFCTSAFAEERNMFDGIDCSGGMGQSKTSDEMISACSVLIKRDPHFNGSDYWYRGIAYFEKGNYDQAISDFSTLIKAPDAFSLRAVSPLSVILARQSRAIAYLKKGNYDIAIAEFSATANFFVSNPDHKMAPINLAVSYGGRADAYRAKKIFPSAILDYREAISLVEKFDPHWNEGGCYGPPFLWRHAVCMDDPTKRNMLAWLHEGLSSLASQTPSAVPQAAASDSDCTRAESHWKTVDALGVIEGYQDHLARFPNCAFATIARIKIEQLKKARQ